MAPGMPQKVRDHLFQAFKGSMRKGGTGPRTGDFSRAYRREWWNDKVAGQPGGGGFQDRNPGSRG